MYYLDFDEWPRAVGTPGTGLNGKTKLRIKKLFKIHAVMKILSLYFFKMRYEFFRFLSKTQDETIIVISKQPNFNVICMPHALSFY